MKEVWILNHYATDTYFNEEGRHYSLSKYLNKEEYKVTIFCANTVHGKKECIKVDGLYETKYIENIKYVFIKCPIYNDNGISRIKNMISYFFRLKQIYKKFDKPDIIIGSQVHPFACLAAIQISKRVKCPCITEYRDLWPLSIVEYTNITDKNLLIKILYSLEKYLYIHSDGVIFTMPGGIDYLKSKNYSNKINFDNVYYINNGVDLNNFNFNQIHYKIDENEFKENIFTIIYSGSLRSANHVERIFCSLKLLDFDFKVLLYGRCDNVVDLEKEIKNYGLNNKVYYRGCVQKKYIPFILSSSDLNLIYWNSINVTKYGISANKIFEYLAAGKPLISNNDEKYDFIEKNGCGFSYSIHNEKEYADAIRKVYKFTKEERKNMEVNLLHLSKEFDYKNLSKQLDKVICRIIKEGKQK